MHSTFHFSLCYHSDNWFVLFITWIHSSNNCDVLCPVYCLVHSQYGRKQAELTIQLRENRSTTYLMSTGAPSSPPAALLPQTEKCCWMDAVLVCFPDWRTVWSTTNTPSKENLGAQMGGYIAGSYPELKTRNKEVLSFHLNSKLYFSDGLVKPKSYDTLQNVFSGALNGCNLKIRYFSSLGWHRIWKNL